MAGWELMPHGSTAIMSCEGEYGKPKLIGHWRNCRVNKNGELIGLVSTDGVAMEITGEKIYVLGYEEPWLAVTRMDGNANRKECAAWVYQLIKEGKFEHHREAGRFFRNLREFSRNKRGVYEKRE